MYVIGTGRTYIQGLISAGHMLQYCISHDLIVARGDTSTHSSAEILDDIDTDNR